MTPRILAVPTFFRWLTDLVLPLLGFLGALPAVAQAIPVGSIGWGILLALGAVIALLGAGGVARLRLVPGYLLVGNAQQAMYVEDARFLSRFARNLGLGLVIGLLGGWLLTVVDWYEWFAFGAFAALGLWAILRRLQMRASIRYEGQRLFSPADGVSIEVPLGWEHRQVFGLLGLIDSGAIANLAPAGTQWPNIEVTAIGDLGETNVRETQKFAHYFCGKRGWPIVAERFFEVAGLPAYEVTYRQGTGLTVCKVSVVTQGKEYLIQLATDALERDKPIFDACVRSFQLT